MRITCLRFGPWFKQAGTDVLISCLCSFAGRSRYGNAALPAISPQIVARKEQLKTVLRFGLVGYAGNRSRFRLFFKLLLLLLFLLFFALPLTFVLVFLTSLVSRDTSPDMK